MDELSLIFKALSDPLRLRILHRLLRTGKEAYGEELAGALGIPPYQLSRHLKILKATGLVSERREGRWVYYSLAKDHDNDQVLGSLRRLLAEAKPPAPNGNSHRTPASAQRRLAARSTRRHGAQRADGRSPQVPVGEEINWNEGPAIPGML